MMAVERSLPLVDVVVLSSIVGTAAHFLRRGRRPHPRHADPGGGHVRIVRLPYDWERDGE